MKTLFVSLPRFIMTREQYEIGVEKMTKIAEIMFGEQFEAVYLPTVMVKDDTTYRVKNEEMYLEAAAIKAMSECDAFIGIDWISECPECDMEHNIANMYDIPKTLVQPRSCEFLKDVMAKLDNKRYRFMPVGSDISQ